MGEFTLQRRLIVSFLAILFFRIGSNIPIPGLDADRLADFFSVNKETFSLFEEFSGGALARLSIFSLGVMPYITAMIIIQVIGSVWEPLRVIKKSGLEGQNKIVRYTRYVTFCLAIIQSIGISLYTSVSSLHTDFIYYTLVVTTLVTGTMLLTWVGEIVSRYGIVNGVSLIIFTGITSNLLPSIGSIFEKIRLNDLSIFWLFAVLCICIFSVFFIVFVEQSIRYITVTYVSRQKGKRLYAAQKNTLPLKINMAGVMAPIFASSILLFPTTLLQWAELSENSICSKFFYTLSAVVEPGTFGYILLFVISIFFFSFLYTSMVFNSSEVSSNLKKSGAFITNCRPGLQTTLFINFVTNRLTVLGAVYIVIIAILPEIFMFVTGISFYFGGTSILILVVVAIELISSIQTYMLSVRYKKIVKNSSLF